MSHALEEAGPRSTMSPDDPVQTRAVQADLNCNTNAQPYACGDCPAQFSTLSKKNKHRNGHLKPYNCLVPECLKKFSQKQSLDRHHEACHRKSSIPSKYYHCTTHGCKYSSWGSRRKTFSREDHVKTHIKDYGHYGPASPSDRRRRPCDKAGLGIILVEIQVEALFEEWSPACNSESIEQFQRTVKRCVFNSLKTNLWYRDDIGDFYTREGPPSSSVFHCDKVGCYFNVRSPEGVSSIAFKSNEALLDHYRQAHISSHPTSFFDQPFQSSIKETSHESFNSMSATVLSLPSISNEASGSPDLPHGQYLSSETREQPWSPQHLRWATSTTGDDNMGFNAPPNSSNYFTSSRMDLDLSDKATIAILPSNTSYSSNLVIDGLSEAPSDGAMSSYSCSPTNQFNLLSPYSETDDRTNACSGNIVNGPEAISVFKKHSTSGLASSRNPLQCNHCQMLFTRKADRERHEKTRHILSSAHRCIICNRTFIRKDKFLEHSRKHGESLFEQGSMKALSASDPLLSQTPELEYPGANCNPILGDAAGFVESEKLL